MNENVQVIKRSIITLKKHIATLIASLENCLLDAFSQDNTLLTSSVFLFQGTVYMNGDRPGHGILPRPQKEI